MFADLKEHWIFYLTFFVLVIIHSAIAKTDVEISILIISCSLMTTFLVIIIIVRLENWIERRNRNAK